MDKRDSDGRERALAIEYWLASALVAGAFVAGLIAAASYLLGR